MKAIWKDVVKDLEAGRELIRIVKACARAVESKEVPAGELPKLKAAISKGRDLLRGRWLSEELRSAISDLLSCAEGRLTDAERKAGNEFGYWLEKALRERFGFGSEGGNLEGAFPKFRFFIFAVDVDLRRKKGATLWYGPHQERIGTIEPDPSAIADALKKFYDGLLRLEKEGKFLSAVLGAYRIATYRRGVPFGEHVPVCELLPFVAVLMQDGRFLANPLKANYRDFGRAHYSFLLSRFCGDVVAGCRLELRGATRAYTRRRKDFIWIPKKGSQGGVYVSHLRFEEVGK